MKVTNSKNGESIESPFATTKEAANKLAEACNNVERPNTFAQSLILAFAEDYLGKKRLSQNQEFWIHKLAIAAVAPPPAPTASFDMSKLLSIFKGAAAKLKRPAIVLSTGGKEVKVSLASDRSRYTGQLMIASPSFGDKYYGRIDQNGEFFKGRDESDDVMALLTELQNDPATTAAKHGRLTGLCCFCNKKLTDDKSTAVGYGKTCAKNFGIAWGKKAAQG
jgi:hypothetical protein